MLKGVENMRKPKQLKEERPPCKPGDIRCRIERMEEERAEKANKMRRASRKAWRR